MVDRFRRHLARAAARSVVPVLSLVALWGCNLNPNVSACSVSVAPSSITVPVNSSVTIAGTAFDCSGNSIKSKTINFSSANSAIATVTTSGQVIGVSVGQTTIAGVANGQQGTAQVTVTPELPTTVTVSPATLTLRLTNQKQLTATAKNAQGTAITGRTFRWSS
ncbi:MAG: Ig-like domain-containing protein, partial [Gemmatimonadaceae bacterium]